MSSSSRGHNENCPSIVQAREEPPLVANVGNVVEQGPVRRVLTTAEEIASFWKEIESEEVPDAAEVRAAEEVPEVEQEAEEEPEAPSPPTSININLEATITEDLNNFLSSPKPMKKADASIRRNRDNESPVASRNLRATRGANGEGGATNKTCKKQCKGTRR